MSEDQAHANPPSDPQKPRRVRSPAYPALSLPEAIEKAKVLYGVFDRHPGAVDSASQAWGYAKEGSTGPLYLAALRRYGLIEEVEGGKDRQVKLTQAALKIILGHDPSELRQLYKEAALKPQIFNELWGHYGGELPPDVPLRYYLVMEKGFNKDAVKGFIDLFRATIAFAGLSESDNANEITIAVGDKNEDVPSKQEMPIPAPLEKSFRGSPEKREEIRVPAPQKQSPPMNPTLRYLPIPLDIGDAPIPVGMSADDFDLLLETLKLWKKKIVRSEYPAQAIWANKDHDEPVTITGMMGERDGVKYYCSSTGTGIPGNELVFLPPV